MSFSIKHVDFYYGSQHALHDINVDFDPKGITAFIGPSGSGKSTLLRTLNRIYQLHPGQRVTGKILYNEQDIIGKGVDLNDLRKRIGMVFQKPTPFPMSIFQNISFAVKKHEPHISRADLEERVHWALAKAGLWEEVKDALRSRGTDLSGGQQQRLCIARTVAVKPEVVLLDEPTSALDPISARKIETLAQELQADFKIIIVTHKMVQATRISDETLFMLNGHVVEFASTRELFNNPKDPRTKEYIGAGLEQDGVMQNMR